MTPQQYIDFLAEHGFKLSIHGDRLRVSDPERIGPGTIQILKRFKTEIVAALRERETESNTTT